MNIPAHIRQILEGEESCATSLVVATTNLYGSGCVVWEPETLRLEFIEDELDIPPCNIDALMAGFTLMQTDAFFWDPSVFAQTCVAFNQLPCDPTSTPELTPAQIAWAVDEAYKLCPEVGTVFDTAPIVYAATCLQAAGMAWAPGDLSFLNEILFELAHCDEQFVSEIKKRWADIVSTDLREFAPAEDPLGVQLALCAATTLYAQDMGAKRAAQFAQLHSA